MFSRPITTTTTPLGKQNTFSIPPSLTPRTPRSGTVADRIKAFNTRASQVQAETAQVRLLKSRHSTPPDHRSRSSTPFATPSASTEQFFDFPTPTPQSTALSVTPKRHIPGGWPVEEKPVAIYGTLLAKDMQRSAGFSTADKPTSEGTSLASGLLTPRNRAGTLSVPDLVGFKRRETQNFEAPAGPRTEYAYEHHSKQKTPQSPALDEYNPDLSTPTPPAPVTKALPASAPQAAPPVAPNFTNPSPAVTKEGTHRFSESDTNSAWSKFRRLDKEEKAVDHKSPASLKRPLASPVTSRASSVPNSPRSLRRPVSEGYDILKLTLPATSTAPNKDGAPSAVASVPLSDAPGPQAVLTLTVVNAPQATVQTQPSVAPAPASVSAPATAAGPASTPAPATMLATTTAPSPLAANEAIVNPSLQTVVVSENAPLHILAPATEGSAPIITIPLQAEVIVAAPPMPPVDLIKPATTTAPDPKSQTTIPPANASVPSDTASAEPAPGIHQPSPDARAILDAVVVEHRTALTSISRKLATELARLTADYDSALPSAPSAGKPSTAAVPSPTTSSASLFPEPHHTLANEVVPELTRQNKRMADLVDEVVRNAKEVWCVNLPSHLDDHAWPLPFACCCPAGWNAKTLQIRQEQRERAQQVESWTSGSRRKRRRRKLCSDIQIPAPLCFNCKEKNGHHRTSAARRHDLHEQRWTRHEVTGESCCILPISMLADTALGDRLLHDLHRHPFEPTPKDPLNDQPIPAAGPRFVLRDLRTRNPRCFVFPPLYSETRRISNLMRPRRHSSLTTIPRISSGTVGVEREPSCWDDAGILEEYLQSGTAPFARSNELGMMDGLVEDDFQSMDWLCYICGEFPEILQHL